jgi:hypothetical protein
VGGPKRDAAIAAGVFLVILIAVVLRSEGPPPREGNAPPSQFSAVRAATALKDVLGGNVPHPVGSAAHEAVRTRLSARFHSLGYDVTEQRTFACSSGGVCAPLVNLIARAPGQPTGDTLMIAAHYDSVPAGPGASDDGLGVATALEVARAIRSEHLRNAVEFVITDGEEAGLLGAEGLVADGNAARNVVAVINTEARGTAGRSFLFETSSHNRWLIPIVARTLPRPATSSLYFNIYELLPNDTDMTVFKRAGIAGLNFANIGRVVHYHTPLDSLENLSLPLLQDDGDHVLAMTRALGNAELRQTSDQNAVWFDVLSFFIIWWPQGLTVWLTLIALAMVLIGAVLRLRENETTSRAITFGVLAWLGSVFGALVTGVALGYLANVRSGGATWVAHPLPSIVAMALAGLGVAVLVAGALSLRARFDGIFYGGAICWCVMTIALLIYLPGGSYLALVPALVLGVCALLRAIVDLNEVTIAAIGCVVAGILLLPVALSFYDALGGPVLPAVAAIFALVATTFAVVVRRGGWVMLGAAAVLVIVAITLPPYTAESPRRNSLRYLDDGTRTVWQADRLLPGFKGQKVGEWINTEIPTSPAPDAGLQGVEVRVVREDRSGGKRTLVVALHSPRGAQRLGLLVHAPSLASMRVNGVAPRPTTRTVRNVLNPGWYRVSIRGTSDAEVEIALKDEAEVELVAADVSYDLPPTATQVIAARNAALGVPSDDGDTSTTLRRSRH